MMLPKQSEQYPDWTRIPLKLQHQFFELAEHEAKKTRQRLLEDAKKLESFRQFLRFEPVSQDDSWKDWRIACVDGSDSPVASERIGARYGTCSAGYMIFEGNSFTGEEDYLSGQISHAQTGDPEFTKKILELLTVRLERELALLCLREKDVDLILIDGSFFGFRARCSEIRSDPTGLREFPVGADLVDSVREKTVELLNSKKAVGVIKRVRTSAFDGWLAHKNGNENECLDRNDRDILSALMPARHWFAYEWLLGSPEAFNHYSRFRTTMGQYPGREMDGILRECELKFAHDVDSNLNYDASIVLQAPRYFIRCCQDAMPICFETHRGFDVTPILAYMQANHNGATGLPFPIDLIDQNVTLPRGFTREFVEEIEAQLIRDRELSKHLISNHFTYLNPQKEEG